ncbi:hypothetical protein [uncultured Flavobacterium sp.]|uniref:hypothetical protein n=1 Tax=uncultured Flavobacterium sp. TaxID=165435 RepID=UPI0030CA369B|tara:strand:- start:114 stop:344 length:231 start_codon:yes stop_codon:yes gene_type:complete
MKTKLILFLYICSFNYVFSQKSDAIFTAKIDSLKTTEVLLKQELNTKEKNTREQIKTEKEKIETQIGVLQKIENEK